MLLELADGGIREIESDSEAWGGCETCDYGSSYVNEYTIHLTSGKVKIKVDKMYNYALSDGHMMKVILPNVEEIKKLTEQEFVAWIESQTKEEIKKETYSFESVDLVVEFVKNNEQ